MSKQQAVVNMIESIVNNMHERVVRGEFDYEKDARQLKQLIQQAETLEAYQTIGMIRHTLALMHIWAGYPSLGLAEQEDMLKNYAQARNAALLVEGTIRLADTYRLLGRYGRALKLLADAEAIATRESLSNESGVLSLLHSTLGLTYLNMNKPLEARTAFEHTLFEFMRHSPNFTLAATQARCGLARLDAQDGRLSAAWTTWRITKDSFANQHDPMRRFFLYSAATYLACLDERGGHEGIAAYLEAAENALLDLPPTYALLMVLDEMRLWSAPCESIQECYHRIINAILHKHPTAELRDLVNTQL